MVRNALVAQCAESRPDLAAAAWRGHPSAELGKGLSEIGRAARNSKPVPESTLSLIRDASVKAPLSAEPFVVRGVEARMSGDQHLAMRAFSAAVRRDSRSIPARYFLAEQYLQAGDAFRGLRQIAFLSRMVPSGVDNLSPYIAPLAKDPRMRGQILSLFHSDPQIEQATLSALATDPANADLIMQLAGPAARPPQWTARLLEGLIEGGEITKARSIWAGLSHVVLAPDDLVFDRQFSLAGPPGPFNWTLTSSAIGLAERQGGGKLHILFYGRESGELASQLLVLKPGPYRLAMRLSGDVAHARSLSWTVTCAQSEAVLLSVPLASRALAGRFDVPASCKAQYLKLVGGASDLPQQVDITVSDLSLTSEARR